MTRCTIAALAMAAALAAGCAPGPIRFDSMAVGQTSYYQVFDAQVEDLLDDFTPQYVEGYVVVEIVSEDEAGFVVEERFDFLDTVLRTRLTPLGDSIEVEPLDYPAEEAGFLFHPGPLNLSSDAEAVEAEVLGQSYRGLTREFRQFGPASDGVARLRLFGAAHGVVRTVFSLADGSRPGLDLLPPGQRPPD